MLASVNARDGLLLKTVLAMIGVVGLSPCVGFASVFVAGKGSEKFISAADGSTGPAFDLCIWVALSFAVLGGVACWIPFVRHARRAND